MFLFGFIVFSLVLLSLLYSTTVYSNWIKEEFGDVKEFGKVINEMSVFVLLWLFAIYSCFVVSVGKRGISQFVTNNC